MGRTSSQRPEERIKGQPDAATDAPYMPSPTVTPPSAPKDFTAQVMARLVAPSSPPDPRAVRLRARRARARLAVRLYISLIVVAGLAIALTGLYAPWILAMAASDLVNATLYAISAVAYAGRSTGGFINVSSVLYGLMLAALVPALLLLWRRARRGRAGEKP